MSRSVNRKLAAILAIDVVGFSRLMSANEVETLRRLNALHRNLVRPTIVKHGGRVVKLIGDGLLAEFASVVQSVQCAADIQNALLDDRFQDTDEQSIRLRIGINFGDIIVESNDIFGDGVNIAARLESLAEPGGICISGKVHDEIYGRLDISFEDIGEQQVKNMDQPIRVWRWNANAPASHTSNGKSARLQRQSSKPTIAVLPFENMSGNSDNDYFSDGIAEDVTTELSRFGSLSVVSRHSAFKYRGSAIDLKEVGDKLCAEFLLSGSVRRGGPLLRITVQLTNVEDGNSVWAERFDRDADELFGIQDEITEKVASIAAGHVHVIDTERAKHKNPDNLQAYDYFLMALDLHKRRDSGRESGLEMAKRAVSMFDKAIEIDESFARAHAWRACAFACTWVDGKTDALEEEALTSVKTALKLDPGESEAHRILGAIYLTKRDYERAEKHFNRAGALNPNDSDIMAQLSSYYSFAGRPEEALASIRRGMSLNPHHPDWYWSKLGLAQFASGDYSASIDAFLNCAVPLKLDLTLLAVCSAEIGCEKESKTYAKQLIKIDAGITISKVLDREPFRRAKDNERIARGLTTAGITLQ